MGTSKVVLLLILCIVHNVTALGHHSPPPAARTIRGTTCRINLQKSPTDVHELSPLLLKVESSALDNDRFILPSASTDILLFNEGDKILLVCPGKSAQEFLATCVGDKTFKVNGVPKEFSSIKCPKTPKSSVETIGKCGSNDKLHIGFQLKSGFLKLIEICYDTDALRPIYAKSTVNKGIAHCQKVKKSCSYFAKEPYNDKLPKDYYKCINQKSTFKKLLGENRFINCDVENKAYLAKGHLAPFADFVYYAQRKATMYYINAVPQWQKFNNANWKILENHIRQYASNTKSDLTVYTGNFGVLKLSSLTHTNVEMFLGELKDGSRVTPVPEQIFKIVCDESRRKGMVYIGINRVDWDGTPFDDSKYRICNNECYKNDLYSGNVDPNKGFIYCCTLPEFMKNEDLARYFPMELKHYLPLKR